MANPGLIKTYLADGAIAPRRIVKFGDADGSTAQATASTEALLGISAEIGADTGKRVDVIHTGIAELECGGTITRGDWLTSDSSGKGVTAAPAAGVNAQVIGRAKVSGVAGDIGQVLIAPGQIQG